MSKIYEALQYTYKKKGKDAPPFPVTAEHQHPVNYAMARPVTNNLMFREEMLGLYKMIDSLLPDSKSRFIQFIGSRQGEGTSTIIREFARICADQIGHSVLLLDADRTQPSHHRYFKIPGQFGWIEALKSPDRLGEALHKIEGSNLVISPATNASGSTPEIYNSPVFNDLCQSFRSEFEMVLVDSAPYSSSPDCLAIASKVDGVVLVVEAEKTKWQIAKTLRDNIQRVGGNILGIALNKRRFYIPHYIYRFI